MKQLLRLWQIFIAATCVLVSGCSRQEETSSSDPTLIQPGAAGRADDLAGYLALKIIKVHEKRKPLDQAPWHIEDGDWTFLECEFKSSSSILIGMKTGSKLDDNIPISWGEARLALSNPAHGPYFIEAFAEAFHQKAPPRHGEKPPGFITIQTAQLGSNLVRDTVSGGFREGRRGGWTATKWFLQDEIAETEVFFNYSIAEKRAEFSEKDPEYRETLVQQLVKALRDGPFPARTLENDPSLTFSGPKVTNWTRIANSNEVCQFSPDARHLMIITSEGGQKNKLFIAQVSNAANRTLLAQFDGSVSIQEILPVDHQSTLLVTERISNNPRLISSADPQKLWLVDAEGKREVPAPPGITSWYAAKGALSPDGRFVVLHSWLKKTAGKNSRVIHVTPVNDINWKTIELPGVTLELVGWTSEKPTAIVLTGMGNLRTEIRKAYALNPETGVLSELDLIPFQFETRLITSPGEKRTMEVIEKEKIIVSDLSTGKKREFTFHPYDRRDLYYTSVKWVNDRYLVFHGLRTALIDTDTLKMNYPASQESQIRLVDFSSDFHFALGYKDDGKYLGRVETLEGE